MDETFQSEGRNRVMIRLDTLVRLRWYAIAGQLIAVVVVAFGMGFPMAWEFCLALIALSALLNLLLMRQNKTSHHVSDNGVFLLLGFDILQPSTLLYLTGGLQNPFSILLLAPVIVSSTSLQLRHTLILGSLAVVMISFLALYHLPLPWYPSQQLQIPKMLNAGTWVAIICTLAFTAIYAFRVAQETRKLGDALSATELVLQREQHLSALDGLAAAAAHELGSPLATIALVSKEMSNEVAKDSSLYEDAILLRSQADRCKDILQKLTSLSSDDEEIIKQQTLAALVEEVVDPLRNFGIKIDIQSNGDDTQVPQLARNPGVHYGLGNLLDNAVSFAKNTVTVAIDWNDDHASIEITDDGNGFPSSVLTKIGQPFLNPQNFPKGENRGGLGLGLFIAKTLLERSGAELDFSNLKAEQAIGTGARIRVVWSRHKLLPEATS